MILFGVERLMKYKLKTRLFAALALSGVSFYWPTSEVFAQEDDFGFIRPAEPSRQDDQTQEVPPITRTNPMTTQAMPPIVNGTSNSALRSPNAVLAASYRVPPIVSVSVVPASNEQATKASAPMPFAASNVYNGAYVESAAANVGYAQHVSPAQSGQQASTQQVAYSEPAVGTGIRAQRDLPPIVDSAQSSTRRDIPEIVQPVEQNQLPPILSSVQETADSAMPPIFRPKSGLDRLLNPNPAGATQTSEEAMIQDEFLLSADGAMINEASKVEPAAFGAAPLLVQDAPPMIDDPVVPGSLPSSSGVLVPVDPATDFPSAGTVDEFPRAVPLDSTNMAPRSVVDSGTFIQPATQPRPTYFEPAVQQQPAFGNSAVGGCSTCGTTGNSCGCSGAGGCNGSGVSACSSCGENGCFDQAAVDNMFNSSGSNAYARRYLIVEGLYINRVDGSVSVSNFGTLNDFDGNGGARITVGRREDSTAGREFQYSGIASIEETITTNNASALASAQLVPFGGLIRTQLAMHSSMRPSKSNRRKLTSTALSSIKLNGAGM